MLKRMARSGIRFIDKMDGRQFEVYLKALFRELGYSPMVTKQSNDFGADLVLKGKNRIVIQAKRYGMKIEWASVLYKRYMQRKLIIKRMRVGL